MSTILHDYLAGKPILDIAQDHNLSLREVLDAVRSEEAQQTIAAVREASRAQSELFLQQSRGVVLKRLLDVALRTRELGFDASTPAGAFVLEAIRKACADLLRFADGKDAAHGRAASKPRHRQTRQAPGRSMSPTLPLQPDLGFGWCHTPMFDIPAPRPDRESSRRSKPRSASAGSQRRTAVRRRTESHEPATRALSAIQSPEDRHLQEQAPHHPCDEPSPETVPVVVRSSASRAQHRRTTVNRLCSRRHARVNKRCDACAEAARPP